MPSPAFLLPTMPLSALTADYLKKTYLRGFKFNEADGTELGDEFFENHLANAVDKVERETSVDILLRNNLAEAHDFRLTDYSTYGFFQLHRIPGYSIQEVRTKVSPNQVLSTIPTEWLRFEKGHSQVHIVPVAGSLSQMYIAVGYDYFTLAYPYIDGLPQFWEVDYVSGLDPDAIPRMVVEAICKMAAIEALGILSDLIYPLGVTSSSLSVDGLSQSRGVLSPPFKARIDRYQMDLYDSVPGGGPGLIQQIKNSIVGIPLAAV